MRGNELLEKMELIDPAYIEAAGAEPKKKSRPWAWWGVAAAACICLLAGTATAVSGGGRVWLVDKFTGKPAAGYTESGYELRAEVRKFAVADFSDEVQAAGEEMVAQYENDIWGKDGLLPGLVRREFTSADEAREFIGLDTLKMPDWDAVKWSDINIWGNADGEIEGLEISLCREAGRIELQEGIVIYTEYYGRESGRLRRSVMDADITYTEDVYTTASGNLCQVVSSIHPWWEGYWEVTGNLVDGGILYSLFVAYPAEESAQAEALLHQWADAF